MIHLSKSSLFKHFVLTKLSEWDPNRLLLRSTAILIKFHKISCRVVLIYYRHLSSLQRKIVATHQNWFHHFCTPTKIELNTK